MTGPVSTIPYCASTDLLYGDMPIQSQVNVSQYISNAAEEIDAAIGLMYATPVVTDSSAAQRPLKLLLKKINAQLATGRIITTVAAMQENEQVHAYGLMLLQSAQEALAQLASGNTDLPGLVPVNETTTQGPIIYNQDSESMVNSFYNMTSPDGLSVRPWPYGQPWRH